MSFFGSLLGDFEDDPFTGHMRQMNRMMNSFFNSSPFGSLMGGSSDLMPFDGRRGGNAMMPFGFPDMDRMFQVQGIDQNRGNCHAFSSSTVMTMSNGPDGRPQVYQASQSVRSGPGGIRETKKAVADSRTGVKKMAIGHHIGERSHILEREQNVRSGEQEEREEFINIEEEEAGEFNREWQQKTRSLSGVHNAIGYPSSSHYGNTRRHRDNTPMLPPAPSQSNGVVYNEDDDDEDDDNDEEDEEGGVSIVELDDDDDCEAAAEDNKSEEVSEKKEKEKSRKREHEPDVHYKSKVQKLHRDSNISK